MLDYPAMRAAALVVQTGSFEKAAQALHVTPSAVSQRVKQLEERLGVVLIVRGNPCVATEKGEWLCRHMDHVGMLERIVPPATGLGGSGSGAGAGDAQHRHQCRQPGHMVSGCGVEIHL